ncbi:crotonase/enoyl-CoA hydratase family protein [Chamaesiphon sp. VAR_48_metabat_403]|uniref:crotonase/enoyl-CoA hydratase family protein n=1 Tax=Chamaesiphon sp. VAR_48_metabat_403 TaxID=2964700 RepID=UPI00286DE0A2|nr:crotonase/enoyl-CoA hydratase family protein [Chamaesiphon sp. VAR_48_metabat_403]
MLNINFSEQLCAYYQPEQRAMWSIWHPSPRPCFNMALLGDLKSYCEFLSQSQTQIEYQGELCSIEYVVLASKLPGVFNLGGDIELFLRSSLTQDRSDLLDYARACIDVIYACYSAFNLPVTTISLVQGDALGGGFETALSCDIIVAERSSRFGFPEIKFGMFPGMGAYSLLYRRIGLRCAEELITSGKIYTAGEMLDKGLIHFIVEDGDGETGISELIDSRKRRRNSLNAIGKTRRRVQQIEYAELLEIVEIWVDCALNLTEHNLDMMRRLVSRQDGIKFS